MRCFEIIEIDGQKINTSQLQHWTDIAKECYSIFCNCSDCNFIPDDLKPHCKTKYYVKGYLKMGIKQHD